MVTLFVVPARLHMLSGVNVLALARLPVALLNIQLESMRMRATRRLPVIPVSRVGFRVPVPYVTGWFLVALVPLMVAQVLVPTTALHND